MVEAPCCSCGAKPACPPWSLLPPWSPFPWPPFSWSHVSCVNHFCLQAQGYGGEREDVADRVRRLPSGSSIGGRHSRRANYSVDLLWSPEYCILAPTEPCCAECAAGFVCIAGYPSRSNIGLSESDAIPQRQWSPRMIAVPGSADGIAILLGLINLLGRRKRGLLVLCRLRNCLKHGERNTVVSNCICYSVAFLVLGGIVSFVVNSWS
ncbi:hypothetical protein CKAH01_19102 [Colletotrichum kahawae]|uniref:Uncharacterized protein n=1 Tax=Colletotrichum kahawae TaxID=34407 RepID=A0AAD9Y080_COLKA|nr:hypothetical protein CKAH01_19102 [Colletotrichum kahawae]